jgi:hypothetical protein
VPVRLAFKQTPNYCSPLQLQLLNTLFIIADAADNYSSACSSLVNNNATDLTDTEHSTVFINVMVRFKSIC